MKTILLLAAVLLVSILALTACSPAVSAVPSAAAAQGSYTDPFAYCAAVGNADTPDARYTGEKLPASVVAGLRKASNSPTEVPLDRGTFWRCMDGKVYACFVGANLPCDSKANVDKTPSAEENDYCKANPTSDFIPAAVSGHDTVYEWGCKDGAPQIVKQVFQVDARGYIGVFWYALSQ